MKRLLLVVPLVVLLLPVSIAPAKGGGKHEGAAKHCKAVRAEMGREAFRASFGNKDGKRALRRCVKAQRKAKSAARRAALRECRADHKRGRALRRCVRAKLAKEPAAKPESFKAAAEKCSAKQAEDPEGFAEEYGDGSEAFGKCVAEHAEDDDSDEHEDEGSEEEDSEEPDSEDEPADEPDSPDEL